MTSKGKGDLMRGSQIVASAFGAFALGVSSVMAGPCDYRPTEVLGNAGAAVAAGGPGAVLAANGAMEIGQIYLIVHSTSGATMLGSTLAGSSAAGTLGILSGSGSGLGAVAAAVSAPAVVLASGVILVSGLGFEGVCYLSDERIEDFTTVYAILQQAVAAGDRTKMGIVMLADGPWLWIEGPGESVETFAVKDLFIQNGKLIYNGPGFNKSLAQFAVATKG